MPQNNKTMKMALGAAAFAALCLLGLVTLLMIGAMNTGLPGLVVGMILAVLPVPFYVAMALWVDRYEKEPGWMLAAAFLWGATGAVFFAFIFNSINAAVFGAVGGQAAAGFGGSVISAPFVEELAKGIALFLFFFWKKDEFDDVIDGVVYAAMVGLGFAMTENVSYYGQALQGGLGGTFFVRGVLAPFSHPLFTAMTGIGLGLSRETLRKPLKTFAPIAGLATAMALHATWNLSASFGAAFLVAYLVIMMPAFFGLLGVVLYAQARERKIIRANLMPYVQSGHVSGRGGGALPLRRADEDADGGHAGAGRGRLEARGALPAGGQRAGVPPLAHRARHQQGSAGVRRARGRVPAGHRRVPRPAGGAAVRPLGGRVGAQSS